MTCEYCDQEAYDNLVVEEDGEEIELMVCEEHLMQVMDQTPQPVDNYFDYMKLCYGGNSYV